MEKIPTAIEYKDYFTEKMELEPEYYNDYIDKMMIEFAKLHVEAALKEASEKIEVPYIMMVNSYPLTNIK